MASKIPLGDLDPASFLRPAKEPMKLSLNLKEKKLSTVESTLTHRYEINNKVVEELAKSNFQEICNSVFFANKDTVKERLQRTLGWMTKARASEDVATRFLFFFTALEALLTSSEKDTVITDTIARNVATIIAKIDYRYKIYKEVKTLYATRSRLVHSGMRDVMESECMSDAALDVIRKLIGVRLRHDNTHIPHQLLTAGGVFVEYVAFADEMDFEFVFPHQGIQNRRMGKAALQAVNTINNQSNALGLLADKFNHPFKFRPIAFGR